MKISHFIIFIGLLYSCASLKDTQWKESNWGVLESEVAYLYQADSLNAIVYKEIKSGSILFFHQRKGDFQIVYTIDPNRLETGKIDNFKYYLYKPNYSIVSKKYKKIEATIYELPFDIDQKYIRGERGGCYYINKNGHKTYVNRDYCSDTKFGIYKAKVYLKPSSKCTSKQCSGLTQKQIRCKNQTTNCSGKCHLHK